MADPDRLEPLLAAAHQRHVDARRRTVEALRRLDSSGEPISFAAVALAAGVSRGFLYRQADLRAEIENLRLSRNHKDRLPGLCASGPPLSRSVSNSKPSDAVKPSCEQRTAG